MRAPEILLCYLSKIHCAIDPKPAMPSSSSVQVCWRSAALLELLAADAGAGLVSAHLRLKDMGHRSLVNSCQVAADERVIARNPAFVLADPSRRAAFAAEYARTAALYYRGQPPFADIVIRIHQTIERL